MLSRIFLVFTLITYALVSAVTIEQCTGVNGTDSIPAAILCSVYSRTQITRSLSVSQAFYELFDNGYYDEAILTWYGYYDPEFTDEQLWAVVDEDLRGLDEDEPERVECLILILEQEGQTGSTLYKLAVVAHEEGEGKREEKDKEDECMNECMKKCHKNNLAANVRY
ncbi:hypothetical protein Kpol_297p1 [Vanderwaltozyma polyspora DSM 70294]|uniref:Uncharacterized protein n=1 Tax=Vanderwaltozyma polyspora (strain ATCC 22028 / DSM 70294 / BCRC 21397 / CBS 2163 / NBRC 10782 / NRRL Y-8283 / UCD 57-17) TaxID=436907 RepID=A7TSK5_VANPO|nr:uncharacterized protein Kpol_297p1 [Vanderwaltozyma polyspora DSM 70294]EDO14740.1 hypothetical protein Kpol_297p1 [Vanderwaltozyma polyspora DSM 70294]